MQRRSVDRQQSSNLFVDTLPVGIDLFESESQCRQAPPILRREGCAGQERVRSFDRLFTFRFLEKLRHLAQQLRHRQMLFGWKAHLLVVSRFGRKFTCRKRLGLRYYIL